MKIIIDFQETRNGLIDFIDKKIDLKIEKLKVGDFIISKDVIVERKTVDDFVSSLIDGRLFNQAKNMRENYPFPIFIIEGDFDGFFSRNISSKAVWSSLISLILNYDSKLLFTSSLKETAEVLELLAKKEQLHEKKEIVLRNKLRKLTLKEQQQFLLEGLPGIGPKLAKNLLNTFKTPQKVINASFDELVKVEKIGPKKGKLILKILRQE